LSALRLEVLAIRYRMANGLRSAMSVWTAFLIGSVVAAALDDAPPVLQWGRQWGSSPHRWRIAFAIAGGLAFGVRPILRQALRRYGQEPMEVLPLTRRQRLRIDAGAVVLFMTPPLLVIAVMAVAGGVIGPALVAIVLALAAQTMTLGAPRVTEMRPPSRRRSLRLPNDLRWLLRSGRFAGSVILALACVGGARLAIANNGVTDPMSATRIESLFGALAAAALAAAVTHARHDARSHRAHEMTLPVSSARRIGAFCVSTLPFAAPLLLTRFAAVLSIALYLLLVLLGEHSSLRRRSAGRDVAGTGAGAAILCAIDSRAALLLTLVLLPVAWRLALRSDERCDVPLSRSGEAT
jgi:hypothetical protein